MLLTNDDKRDFAGVSLRDANSRDIDLRGITFVESSFDRANLRAIFIKIKNVCKTKTT